jgi:hypothetical protein
MGYGTVTSSSGAVVGATGDEASGVLGSLTGAEGSAGTVGAGAEGRVAGAEGCDGTDGEAVVCSGVGVGDAVGEAGAEEGSRDGVLFGSGAPVGAETVTALGDFSRFRLDGDDA